MGGKGRGFLAHSQNSGGVVGRPLPTKMESLFPSFIPGHQHLVYTRSSTSSCLYQVINVFCLYQVINVLLFIAGHPAISCLYQRKRTSHTSGRGVVGASWAAIMPTSGSLAVCVSGTWASSIHAYGMVPGSE